MERLARTLGMLGVATLVAGAPASAGVAPPEQDPVATPPPVSAPPVAAQAAPDAVVPAGPGATEPLYATPTTLDRIGRIVAPVFVNGRGPYRFIVDTGASRSVVSPRLVAELGLTPSQQPGVMVTGVTGSAPAQTVVVESLRAGGLVRDNVTLPVIWPDVMTGADGILGVEGLPGLCLTADFVHDRLTLTPAAGCSAGLGSIRVQAQLRSDGLMFIPVRIGGVKAIAVVDTGAERTLGNRSLERALKSRRAKGEKSVETIVSGVTPDVASGDMRQAPVIEMGDAEVRQLAVTFGDMHVFRTWGLDRSPALILGMDFWGTLRLLAIDYHNAAVYLKP